MNGSGTGGKGGGKLTAKALAEKKGASIETALARLAALASTGTP